MRAAIAAPEQDRKLRDVLVRVGLSRSPDLAARDATIAAVERQLTARRRAFWVPSLNLGAGVDHLVNRGNGSTDDFDQTEWPLQAGVEYPLFEGGARFAELSQAHETLASARTQRRATALSIDQRIRSAFARYDFLESLVAAEREVALYPFLEPPAEVDTLLDDVERALRP